MANTSQTTTPRMIVCDGTEPGFELDTSPGVRVQPLLATKGDSNVDVFYLILDAGAEVTPESHPYSETLVVLQGELSCRTGDARPVTVGAGQIWHTAADTRHHVKNNGNHTARAAMHLGL